MTDLFRDMRNAALETHQTLRESRCRAYGDVDDALSGTDAEPDTSDAEG